MWLRSDQRHPPSLSFGPDAIRCVFEIPLTADKGLSKALCFHLKARRTMSSDLSRNEHPETRTTRARDRALAFESEVGPHSLLSREAL